MLSIFLFLTLIISSILFLLIEAKTFNEYADSFYLSVTTVVGCIISAFIAWNGNSFFIFCDNSDSVINEGEF